MRRSCFSLTVVIAALAGATTVAFSQTVPASQPAPSPAATSKPSAGSGNDLLVFEDIAPVVVSAARHAQRTDEAAASVTVVTAEEINLFGYRNLSDILRAQRGFYITSDGLNSFLGVRGFMRPGEWNARILVMIDGRPTREPIFGQTHLDQDMIVPVEMIKRVEIIRGPGSALYGSNAVFAVINIITRDGADVKNWGELKTQGGNKETARGEAVFGKKFNNGLDILIGASRFSSQGDDDIRYFDVHDADRNYGHIRDSDYEGAGAAFLKMTYQEFTLEADFNKRDKGNRAATYLASWLDPGRMAEIRDDVSLKWDHNVNSDQSLHALVYYSHYSYRQYWGLTDPEPYTYWSTAQSHWLGEDIHYDWKTSQNNRLIFGAEGMQTLSTQQRDFDTLNGAILDVDPSVNWWALYAQDEYSPTKWLTLVAGLRMDKIQRFDPLFDPRAAAIFKLGNSDTLKALYGRAFRAPNLYEMFYSSPGTNSPNPDLKPEINDTYEVLWGHDFKNGWHSETGYYLWRMTDAMGDGVKENALQTQNVGTMWAHGVEGEVQKNWANGARVRVSGSLGRAYDQNNDRPTHSPDALLSLAGAVPVYKRTFLALETQLVGPQLADTGDKSNITYITNIVLTSKNVWRGMDVQVGLYNLFGETALIPRTSVWDQSQPWLREPGPLLMLSVTYRF